MTPGASAVALCRRLVRSFVVRQVAPQVRLVGSARDHHNREESSVQERVRLLAVELSCQQAEICTAIRKYPRLLSVRESKLLDILHILKRENISKDEILTYPDIFTHSLKSLTERIGELKNLNEKVKLTSLRESNRLYGRKISRIQMEKESEIPYENKGELVCERLGCSPDLAEELLEKHDLNSSRLSTLKAKLDILTEIPPEMILDKLWILRFPSEVLEYRLEILKSNNLTPENCESFLHLLSCEETNFDQRLELHVAERSVLGDCLTKSEYLQKRLDCDQETISLMVRKNHKLLSTNAPKLKQHLDFLESKNFDLKDAISYPRLFNFSVKTIEARYRELRELCFEVGVRELALDARSYKKFVDWR